MAAIADVSERTVAELVELTGRAAVVTGGAQGLGRAIAQRLAEAGADVLLADINAELASTAAAELNAKYSGSVKAALLDVRDVRSIDAVAQKALDEFGGLDVWVNNAGVFPSAPIVEISDEQWDHVFSVNTRGAFLGSRAAMRHMIERERGGVIINISSLAGLRGISPGLAAYVSSKHAVTGLTRQMALECAPHRIRVLAVAPCFMVTEGNMALIQQNPQMAAVSAEAIPSMLSSKLGRVGVADDIARTVLFCACDLSIFMTGTTLVVDAGETA